MNILKNYYEFMNKDVLRRRCFYINLYLILFYVFYIIEFELESYFKKRDTINNINSLLTNINSYIRKYSKDNITNITYDKIQIKSKPKITALITSYNSENYIETAIRSVQNQNFLDIEILVVDDCSSDNSVGVAGNFKKFDKRIKIIKNKDNKGVLYSKSLGILKAKGKFIMFLDSDDLFVNEEIFSICYEEAMEDDIEIVEFSGLESDFNQFQINGTMPKIPLYSRYKKNNEIIKQPQLSQYLYKKLEDGRYKLIDGYLWGKSIKTQVLKKTLKIIGPNIYEKRLNYGDDRLINLVLFRVAKSFKFIKEYGYIYNQNNESITHSNTTIKNCRDELNIIYFTYHFTKNTNETDIVAYEVLHRWNKILYPGLNNKKNKKKLKKIIKRLLKDKYVSEVNKIRLLNITINMTSNIPSA